MEYNRVSFNWICPERLRELVNGTKTTITCHTAGLASMSTDDFNRHVFNGRELALDYGYNLATKVVERVVVAIENVTLCANGECSFQLRYKEKYGIAIP